MADITIIYKSGTKVYVKADKFKVTNTTMVPQRVSKLEWENMNPPVLFAGLDNIESIWEGRI